MNLITDRTHSDVERWRYLRDKGWVAMTEKERKEWLGEIVPTPAASKGMYTHNDLNRVENAVASILRRFKSVGYAVPNLVIKTDWTYTDAVSETDMMRYYGNIAAVRELVGEHRILPEAPTIRENLDYKRANDIEKILLGASGWVEDMIKTWYYVGEIYAGEV